MIGIGDRSLGSVSAMVTFHCLTRRGHQRARLGVARSGGLHVKGKGECKQHQQKSREKGRQAFART